VDPLIDSLIFPCNSGTYTVQYPESFTATETPTTGGNLTSGGGCSGEFSLDTSVTSIAYVAFMYNTTITKIIFPEGLRNIGESAFDSTNIREVSLPASLETVGVSSYIYVSSIETFTTYSSMNLPDGFLADNSLRSVSILGNIVNISNFAFARNVNLSHLILPNSVVSIGANAFTNTALKTITFPASLQSVGANFFLGSPVETFTTNSSMEIGNFDFLKGSTLRSVQILGNVETIGSNAFDSATALSTVTLPASLKTIGSEAFKNARSLTSITIPSGLLNIEANSFDIERFTSLTYNGSNSSILLTLQTFMAPGYFVNDIDPSIAIRAAEARARAEAAAKEAAAKARAEADAKAAQEKAKALEVLQNHVIADDDLIIKGTDYVIQDFAALPITKPTIETYKDAGVPGVTIVNLVLVNDLVDNIKPTDLSYTTMCDAVNTANIVIRISQITILSNTIVKNSELKTLAIDTIAPRERRDFTNYLITCPIVERDTPTELQAAAEKFKISQVAKQLLTKLIRQQERADLLEKIAEAFR
jgi:hypothetical protein